jgi:diacylglycerol O-acyltransferase
MKLSPLDLMFLGLENVECPGHVGSLQIYEIPKNYKGNFVRDLKDKLLKKNDVKFPFSHRLKPQGLIPKWPQWEPDEHLDLDYHVRHNALPNPGKMEDLKALVSRLHTRLLDRSRPLWEFYLIEGLEENRFAVYFKTHHSIIDGAGGMEMMAQILTLKPDTKKIGTPWAPNVVRGTDKKKVDPLKRISRVIQNSLKQAVMVPRALNAVLSPAIGLKKTAAGKAFVSKSTFINADISARRSLAFNTLDLREVKAVGKALDGTINDVVLTICSGALAKALKTKKDKIEPTFSAGVPVALPRAGQSNAVATILVNLFPNISNPEKRMKEIHESTLAAKADLTELSRGTIDTMTAMLGGIQVGISQLGIAEYMPPGLNLIISNVPGMREDRYYGGAKLVGMYPLSMLASGLGLNITLISHATDLHFGLLSTPEILSDKEIEKLSSDIIAEFKSLKVAAAKKKRKDPRSKP